MSLCDRVRVDVDRYNHRELRDLEAQEAQVVEHDEEVSSRTPRTSRRRTTWL